MRRPRLFQFSLKALLLMVLVVGSFFGWLGVQLKWKQDRHAEWHWIEQHANDTLNEPARSPRPVLPFGLRVIGETPLDYIPVDVNTMSQDDLAHLKKVRNLFPEAQVVIQGKVLEGDELEFAISMVAQMLEQQSVAGRLQSGN